MRKNSTTVPLLRRLAVGLVLTYAVLIVLFYYLAGEQLHLRKSRGDIDLPSAECGTIELCQGAMVEQEFAAKIQRLESVSVQWGTYYRPNTGTVTLELWNLQSKKVG